MSINKKSETHLESPENKEAANKVTKLIRKRQYALAEEVCREALKKDPENEFFLYNLSLSLSKLGNFEEASLYITEYIKFYPMNAQGYEILAAALIKRQRLDEVSEVWESFFKESSDYKTTANGLGVIALVFLRKKQLDQALTLVSRALSLDPLSPKAILSLAHIKIHLSGKKQTQLFLTKFIKDCKENKTDLQNLLIRIHLENKEYEIVFPLCCSALNDGNKTKDVLLAATKSLPYLKEQPVIPELLIELVKKKIDSGAKIPEEVQKEFQNFLKKHTNS